MDGHPAVGDLSGRFDRQTIHVYKALSWVIHVHIQDTSSFYLPSPVDESMVKPLL